MTAKQTVLAILCAGAIGVLVGRFSLPARVITETKIVEKRVTDTHIDKTDRSVTKVTETKSPDGSVTKVTEIRKDVDISRDKHAETDKTEESKKEVVRESARWSLNALGMTSLTSPPASIQYGAQVEYRLFGPFRTGVFGFANGNFGVSLGVQF